MNGVIDHLNHTVYFRPNCTYAQIKEFMQGRNIDHYTIRVSSNIYINSEWSYTNTHNITTFSNTNSNRSNFTNFKVG